MKWGWVLLALFAATVIVPALSDCSEADTLPQLDFYHASDGTPVREGILQDVHLEYEVMADHQIAAYTVREGTVLHDGGTYMYISGTHSGNFVLRCTVTSEDEILRSTGLLISFHRDPACRDEPVFSSPIFIGEETLIGTDVAPWTRYYLVVETLYPKTMDSPDHVFKGASLNFTVSTDHRYNAVTLDQNWGDLSPLDSMLLRNGERYALPVPVREDFVFTGWYTDPLYGECVQEGSVIYLEHDTTYYAHWWPRGSHHIEISTPSGCLISIEEVAEGTATLSIESRSVDGTVTVSVPETNVSVVRFPLPVSIDTSHSSGRLSLYQATLAREQYEAISQWITDRGLLVAGEYVIPSETVASVDPSALGELSATDAPLHIPFDDASLFLETEMMDYLSGMGEDIRISVSETTSNSLTLEQKRIIGRNRSIDISMTCGGNEVTSFQGTLRIRFAVDIGTSADFAAYCVYPDGTKVDMGATSGDGWVEFCTNHLSVFCLEVHYPEPDRSPTVKMLLIGVIALLLIPNVFKLLRRK